MASSARRVFIGYVASVEAAKAEGDQKTPSWPSLTATPMTGNSEAPLEHLVNPAACKTVRMNSRSDFTSWNLLFSQMGPRWAGFGSEPWGHQPTPWPATAAPGACATRSRAPNRPPKARHEAGYRSPIASKNVQIRTELEKRVLYAL